MGPAFKAGPQLYEKGTVMNGVALTVMLMAGTYGDCVHGDCPNCCYPPSKSLCEVWYEFWCNVSPHDDPRMTRQYWPLEYPGARERGQAAHGVAPTREEARRPYGLGSPILLDEDGNLMQQTCHEGCEEDMLPMDFETEEEYEVVEPKVSKKPKPTKRTAKMSLLNRKRK